METFPNGISEVEKQTDEKEDEEEEEEEAEADEEEEEEACYKDTEGEKLVPKKLPQQAKDSSFLTFEAARCREILTGKGKGKEGGE
ncbi:hypothetical protein M0804_011585 [Polistes exclamans]|nr:hypothetical protein M0804_011585 [Polistes exclamans]